MQVMRALVGGRVIESKHPKFSVGDYVTRDTGSVQTHIISANPEKELYVRDTSLAPPQTYLGGLGV
jgi:NADPH-dependent curcumin reductase CurA